jgi:molecular chaperone GrpE (heat shock protein)
MASNWWGSRPNKVGVAPTYKILQADQVRGTDRERASAVASFVRTAEDAHKLAGHEGFSYFGLDTRGRVGVVRFNGIEVALLFLRQVNEVEPGPSDPVPERTLKAPHDAWIQIDLLNTDDSTKEKGISERLRRALESNKRLEVLWKSEESQRQYLEKELEKGREDREAHKALKEKAGLIDLEIKQSRKEVEDAKRLLQQEQEGRKGDRIRVVEELFPVFNTVWLAGQHRVGDTLYDILRKQLTEALGKVGAELVEPQLGDEFDPQLHHAVHSYTFPTGSKEIGAVVQVNRVGWKLISGQVVSAAEVAVGIEKEGVQEV